MSAGTKAEIEITASTARLPAALRSAGKMVQGFVTKVTGLLSKSSGDKDRDRDVSSIARGAMIGGVASTLAVRGIDKLVHQGKEVFEFNDALTRFGVATRKGGAELATLGQQIRETSNQTGINATEVLRGERAYVDLAGAERASAESMSLVARASQATGADVGDMATVMYSLEQALHVSGREMEDVMGGIVNQSKDGTVHFQQMAQEIIALAPIYARFGVTGRQGAIELGAQLQIVRSGFKDSAEAAVGLKNMWRNLQLHSDKFEKAGVKIFNVDSQGHKKLRSVSDILKDIGKNKLNFDPHRLMKAFGRGESERAYRLLEENVKKYEELVELGERNNVIGEDSATISESSSGRIAIAVEKMKNAVAEAFTPERIEKFAEALEGLVEKAGELAESAGKIGDAFGAIYNLGKGVRDKVSNNSNQNPFRGGDLNIRDYQGREAQYQAAQSKLQSKRAAYDKVTEDVMSSLDKEGRPTERSDIIAAKAVMADLSQDGGQGARTAGLRYFGNANVSHGKYDEIYKKARQEMLEEKYPEGGKSSRVDDDERLAKLIGDAVARSMGPQVSKMPAPLVNLDGNRVSRGTSNATDKRRKP